MNNQGHRVAFSYTVKGGKRSPQTRVENSLRTLRAHLKNLKMRKAQVNTNKNRASYNRLIKNTEAELNRLGKELQKLRREAVKAITAHYANAYVNLYSPVFRQAEKTGYVTRRRGRGA